MDALHTVKWVLNYLTRFPLLDWTSALALGSVFGAMIALFGAASAGTIVAAVTAIIVALSIYPWQKSVDRELELRRERRAIFARYLSAIEAYKFSIFNRRFDDAAELQATARDRFDELVLHADEDVIRAARVYFEVLHNWGNLLDADIASGRSKGDFSIDAEKAFLATTQKKAEMMLLMRRDVVSEPADLAARAVKEMYVKYVSKLNQ